MLPLICSPSHTNVYSCKISIIELCLLCAHTHPHNHTLYITFSFFLFVGIVCIAQAPLSFLSILTHLIKSRTVEIMTLWNFNLLILAAGTAVRRVVLLTHSPRVSSSILSLGCCLWARLWTPCDSDWMNMNMNNFGRKAF